MSRYAKTGRGGANRRKAWGNALRKPDPQLAIPKVRCEGSGHIPEVLPDPIIDIHGKTVRWLPCPRCTVLFRGTSAGRVPTHKRYENE